MSGQSMMPPIQRARNWVVWARQQREAITAIKPRKRGFWGRIDWPAVSYQRLNDLDSVLEVGVEIIEALVNEREKILATQPADLSKHVEEAGRHLSDASEALRAARAALGLGGRPTRLGILGIVERVQHLRAAEKAQHSEVTK